MAGSNYVAYNLAQTRTDAEKLQARNNIGAAALASLAASFESRAPSYNWSANEVCTYGGALWQFDANHSGAWTGADAHIISVVQIIPKVNSLNLNDYSYDSLIDNIQYQNGFNRRGTTDEFFRYYDELNLLTFNLILTKNSSVTATNWVNLFRLTDDRFYFSDYTGQENIPIGVLGIETGSQLGIGASYNNGTPMTNNNIVLNVFTDNGGFAYKDVYMQTTNNGAAVSRSYIVVPK